MSLNGRNKDWLTTLSSGTIKNYDEYEEKFIGRFFSVTEFMAKQVEITHFEKKENESIYDTLE